MSTHSSLLSYRTSRTPPEVYEEQDALQPAEIEQMITRSAKTTAERLASHHKRQTEKEKKLENRLFTLKGAESKSGSIKSTEKQLIRLNAELETETKKARRGQLESRITKTQKSLDAMKAELPKVEEELKQLKAAKTPVKKGRPASVS